MKRFEPILISLALFSIPLFAQQQPSANESAKSTQHVATFNNTAALPNAVVLSGIATTARVADPNELVVFSGRVMRMADFVAAVSSSNEAVQHLRTPEKRNHEKDQQVPPSKPLD
jgi:hypothetical protein